VIFLFSYPSKIPDGKFHEALLTFLYALRLDASTIAYLISPPLVIWAIQQFVKKNFLNRINHFYNLAMISAITIVCIANIALYEDQNSLLSYNTLYLLTPAKIFPYLTTLELIGACIGIAIIIAIFVLLFRTLILMVLPYSTTTILRKLLIIPLLYPVVFVIMRGGIAEAPISEKDACFSDVNFFNHVSINPVWHLGKSMLN
jgi:hypothetical protein